MIKKTILQSRDTKEFPYIEEFNCDEAADENLWYLHQDFDNKILCKKIAYNQWCGSVWYLFYIDSLPEISDISEMFKKVCWHEVIPVLDGLEVYSY